MFLTKLRRVWPVLILSLVGTLLLFSLLLSIFGEKTKLIENGILFWAGFLLLDVFSWAAFYIPIYFFLNAWLLKKFSWQKAILLILSLLPFLTAALFLKVLLSQSSLLPIFESLITSFGQTGFLLVLGGFFFFQVIALIFLGFRKKANLKPQVFVSILNEAKLNKLADNAEKDFSKRTKEGSLLKREIENKRIPQKFLAEIKPSLILNLNESKNQKAFNSLEEEKAKEKPTNLSDENLVACNDAIAKTLKQSKLFIMRRKEKSTMVEDCNLVLNSNENCEEKTKPKKEEHHSRDESRKKFSYKIDVHTILKDYGKNDYGQIDEQTKHLAEILKCTLDEFKIKAEVTGIQKGPVITMFEILPDLGVKLSKIVNLADNIALRLAASRVRIVAPIPGKQAVGIEVPNKQRVIVSLKEVVLSDDFIHCQASIPIILGKDITGNVVLTDLTQMPHLLIAGATGSGKSVCVNSIICSILLKKSPQQAKLILIDPKIVELKYYNDIPHLLTPVITEPRKAFQALQYCITEMERRYALLDALCARDISSYNRKIKKKSLTAEELPHIIIVIDEFADLIASTGKDMESTLARLAAMSRAVGIHIVLATQRPSIDVITGLIKANIPARIAFMVASKFDSRIIIDAVGAEKLLGQGDMLFLSAQDPFPKRIQGAYISEEEVEKLIEAVKQFGKPEYIDDEIFIEEEIENLPEGEADPLYEKALEIVIAAGKASTSYVQRKLKIGYNRAARLIEELEHRGIVGPANGSKAREIIHIPNRINN